VTRRRASKGCLTLLPSSAGRDQAPHPLAVTPHPLVLSLSKDDNAPPRFDKLTMSGLLTGCAIPLVLSLSKDERPECAR